jgi:hypothetical protein
MKSEDNPCTYEWMMRRGALQSRNGAGPNAKPLRLGDAKPAGCTVAQVPARHSDRLTAIISMGVTRASG